ncbi:MAG TPA: acetyl-CoA carboxylase biotin carboxyl carrier protein [Thermoanaerobaculia bacterium]|nr:acetyl-CoA carboxylase biotin carboxyl carrier protein [Thermoanaerobaculia bacterium]
MLSFKEIKELIGLVAEKNLSGIEIERSGFRIRIEGQRAESNGGGAPVYYPALPEAMRVAGAPAGAIAAPAGGAPEGAGPGEAAAEDQLHYIVSPIVGTFYRAASPESDPFVSPGDRVDKNKILCIIEAMKLMNEIESDVAGEVVKVFPQNGQPVEYGEKLFAIRTD